MSVAALRPPEPAADDEGAWLGVERSATGRRWRARPHDEDLARAHALRLDVPEALGRVLAARDIRSRPARGSSARG